MGLGVRVVAALAAGALASAAASGWGASTRLEAVRIVPTAHGIAVAIRTSAPVRPEVSSIRSTSGALQRIYADFPAGTQVAASVGRLLAGAPPVRRVGVGLTGAGAVRVIVDVAAAPSFAVRRPATGYGVVLLVPAPPRSNGDAGPSIAARPSPRLRRPLRVVLDPGHGGDDPGATGVVTEKAVTLAIARRVAALLERDPGAEVTLTRESDRTVPLAERTRRANRAGADLFVSIHANASARRAARGVETYYLDNTEDRATLRLASMENRAGGTTPPDLTNLDRILSSLVQGNKNDASVRFARALQRHLVARLRAGWADVVDLGVKRGPFYVLVGAYMPCVLVETSFVTHPEEGRRLATESYQQAIAEGVHRGIKSFLAAEAHAGTL